MNLRKTLVYSWGMALFPSAIMAAPTEGLALSPSEPVLLAKQWDFAEGLFKRAFYEDALQEYGEIYKGGESRIELDALLRIIECSEHLKKPTNLLLDEYIKREKDSSKKALVLMKKAAVLQSLNQADEALTIYKDLSSQKGDYQEYALYEQGRLLLERKQDDKAREVFVRLLEFGDLETSEVRIYAAFALASLYFGKNDYVNASLHFENIVALKVESSLKESAWSYLITIASRLNEDARLVEYFSKFKNAFPESSLYNELALQAAMGLVRLEKYDLARVELAALEKLSPEQEQLKLYTEALVFYNLSLFDEAGPLFEKVAYGEKQFSEAATAGAYAVFCVSRMDAYKDCQKMKDKFVEKFSESSLRADVHYCVALFALRENDLGTAEAELKSTMSTYLPAWSKVDQAHRVFADFYEKKKAYGAAALLWEKLASRVNADDQRLALFRAIDARLQNKDYKIAMDHARRLEAMGQELSRLQVLMTEIALYAANYEGVLKRALVILKSEGFSKTQLGAVEILKARAHYYLKQNSEARMGLNRAVDLLDVEDAKSGEARLMLAAILEDSNKSTEAAKVYAEYFNLNLYKLIPIGDKRLYDVSRLLELEGQVNASLLSCDELERVGQKNAAQVQRMRTLVRAKKYKDAAVLANDLIGDDSLKTEFRCAVLSIAAYCALVDKKHDKAARFFELALSLNSWEEGDYARALFGRALLSYETNDFTKAWKQSGRVYILHHDKIYTPSSLFLAMRAAVKLKRLNDAKSVRKELKVRYPSYSNGNEVSTFAVKHVLD